MRVEALAKFIKAREAIRLARAAGKKKPWTKDPILRQYRFCNVHREDDTVTKWIKQHWRDPLAKAGEEDLWFWMALARAVNLPESLVELYPLAPIGCTFNPKLFVNIMHTRREAGQKLWTGAYLVATHGHAMDKSEFVAHHILWPLWKVRDAVRPRKMDTLRAFADRVLSVKHQGSFIVGQMIADAKYADPILLQASDWQTFAISGPGSRRGLNRVLGRSVDAPWTENKWKEQLDFLHHCLAPPVTDLHAQDLQNCLCEFDKYERVRLGEGRPRSLYNGG
jgi:hypothetical protein